MEQVFSTTEDKEQTINTKEKNVEEIDVLMSEENGNDLGTIVFILKNNDNKIFNKDSDCLNCEESLAKKVKQETSEINGEVHVLNKCKNKIEASGGTHTKIIDNRKKEINKNIEKEQEEYDIGIKRSKCFVVTKKMKRNILRIIEKRSKGKIMKPTDISLHQCNKSNKRTISLTSKVPDLLFTFEK